MTGEVKKVLIETLQQFIKEFQEKRSKVTDDDVKKFMAVRKINPLPKKFQEKPKGDQSKGLSEEEQAALNAKKAEQMRQHLKLVESLEQRLEGQQFLCGHSPSGDDRETLKKLEGFRASASTHPRVHAW